MAGNLTSATSLISYNLIPSQNAKQTIRYKTLNKKYKSQCLFMYMKEMVLLSRETYNRIP